MSAPRAFVICSDDPLLVKERGEQIMAQARRELPKAEFMLFTDTDFKSTVDPDLSALENELVDPGLFGGDRIIRICLRALNQAACRIMLLIAERMRQGIVVIVELPRVSAAYGKVPPKPYKEPSGRMGLKGLANLAFSCIKGMGGSIEMLYPPEGPQLVRWIQERAAACSLRCSLECAQIMASMGEGNLISIDQTLKLIGMTSKGGDLTPELISKTMASDSRFTGFEFAEAVLGGDFLRALNVLASTTQQGSGADALGLLISRLDAALRAVAAVRGSGIASMPPRERSAFFMRMGVKTPGLQNAVLRAAGRMPSKLFSFLSSRLALASSSLSRFETAKARRALEDLCVSVGNFDVMELQAP
jgi:DNA polymerase III delta subunit